MLIKYFPKSAGHILSWARSLRTRQHITCHNLYTDASFCLIRGGVDTSLKRTEYRILGPAFVQQLIHDVAKLTRLCLLGV